MLSFRFGMGALEAAEDAGGPVCAEGLLLLQRGILGLQRGADEFLMLRIKEIW